MRILRLNVLLTKSSALYFIKPNHTRILAVMNLTQRYILGGP